MSQNDPGTGDLPLDPKQQTLMRSSMVMASGTLISRILGFVRSAMLVAAIGVTAGTAASFQLANTLPNMVYNLLAAGIIDAILIPQIVRALKSRGGNQYVNKLLTAAGSILFLLTFTALVATPVIITILAPSLPPAERALTITFALICFPQIFFYGVYNLLGELLNARGIFGPYMWAPVVNNVVGITALAFYLRMWGPAGEVLPAADFSSTQTYFLAGTATLGVILQAAVLLLPMRRAGVKLRLDFKFRGTDFGSASKVAGWTFATLLFSQIGVISTTNIVTRADTFTSTTGQLVAGIQAYQYAFMIFMVPQSLIAVTLATAIFTRLANEVAEQNYHAVAEQFERGVRLIVLLSAGAAGVLLAASMPIMQILMPTFGGEAASLYGDVLVVLTLSLPSVGVVLMSQRAFFAMENARPVFLTVIIPIIAQVIVGWTIYFTMEAEYWTVGAAGAETVGRIIQGFLGLAWVGRALPHVSTSRILKAFFRYVGAMTVASLAGWGVMTILSPVSPETTTVGRLLDATVKVTVVAIVVLTVYFGMLRVIDPEGFKSAVGALTARIRPRTKQQIEEEDVLAPGEEVDDATTEMPLPTISRGLADPNIAEVAATWGQTPPSWEEILGAEGAGHALSRAMYTQEGAFTGAIPQLPPLEATPLDGIDQTDLDPSPEDDEGPQPDPGDPDPDDSDEDASPPAAAAEGTLQESEQIVSRRQRWKVNMSPAKRAGKPGRFDPTVPTLVLGVIIFISAGWFAVNNLFPDTDRFFADLEAQSSQSATFEQEPAAEEAEEGTSKKKKSKTTPAAPKLTSATIFSWSDDEGDHPELAAAILDGNQDTVWRSRYYEQNEFPEGSEIGVLLNLEKSAVVTEIKIDAIGSGGELVIRSSPDGNPREGEILATSSVDGQTVIKLAQPTKVSALGLTFNALPVDDEGLYRAKIWNIVVE